MYRCMFIDHTPYRCGGTHSSVLYLPQVCSDGGFHCLCVPALHRGGIPCGMCEEVWSIVMDTVPSLYVLYCFRYELPGINGLNFVLNCSLGGGGVSSIRVDPQVCTGHTLTVTMVTMSLT